MKVKSIKVNGRSYHPNYTDGLTFTVKRDGNERYFRTEMNESLLFTNGSGDYDWIDLQPFDTLFKVEIELADGYKWNGKFMKTDCEFDALDMTVKVKPSIDDIYSDILDHIDDEYDLVDLAPATSSINMLKRPIKQVFVVVGTTPDKVVTNQLGNMVWEEDVAHTFTEQSIADIKSYLEGCYFKSYDGRTAIRLDLNQAPGYEYYAAIFNGLYLCRTEDFVRNMVLYADAGQTVSKSVTMTDAKGNTLEVIVHLSVVNLQYSASYAECILTSPHGSRTEFVTEQYSFRGNIVSPDLLASLPRFGSYSPDPAEYRYFIRYLVDEGGNDRSQQDDLVAYNPNYRQAIPIDYGEDVLEFSAQTQAEPTKYGKATDGSYFSQRPGYPISRSTWVPLSIWLQDQFLDESIEQQNTHPYVLKDAYALADVINTFLKKIAPDSGISFALDAQHSNWLNSFAGKICIAPISNVKKTYYENPAKKGNLTFSTLLQMLKDCYGLYWFIDSQKRFHLEHITYFRGAAIGTNITALTSPRNLKKWAYGQDGWTFDKQDLPERIEFEYAEGSTEAFNGGAIEYQSNYVNKGSTDKIGISGFSADVDYIVEMAQNISDDGWVLLVPSLVSGELSMLVEKVPLKGLSLAGDTPYARVQNAKATRTYQIANALRDDMSAGLFSYNGVSGIQAYSIKRAKKQTVTYPGTTLPDPFKRLQSNLGAGEVESIEYKPYSETIKAVIKLDID